MTHFSKFMWPYTPLSQHTVSDVPLSTDNLGLAGGGRGGSGASTVLLDGVWLRSVRGAGGEEAGGNIRDIEGGLTAELA